LILEIEALVPVKNLDEAKKNFRELARQWERIGMTQRDKRAALDSRFAAIESQLKSAEEDRWRKTDPAAKARASEVVRKLTEAVENYDLLATKAEAAGNTKKATEARESAAARRVWLAEAEKGLAEFAD
jgi:membrane protein involved in colicin uptake